MVEAGGPMMKPLGTDGASGQVEGHETVLRRMLPSAKRIVLLTLLAVAFLIYYLLSCLQKAIEFL